MRYIIKVIAVDDGSGGRPYWEEHDDPLTVAVHAIRMVPFAPGEPMPGDRITERMSRVELLDHDGQVLGRGHLQETRRLEH